MTASSTSTPPADTRPPRTWGGGLLGFGVTLGWSLHDVIVFLSSSKPSVVFELFPGWLGAVACGTLLGHLLGRRRFLLPVAVVLGIAMSLGPEGNVLFSRPRIWLPRAALSIVLAILLSELCARRLGRSRFRIALAVGVLTCAAATAYRTLAPPTSWLPVGFAEVLFVTAFVGRPGPRRWLTGLALAPLLFWTGTKALERTRPTRADLAAPVTTPATGAPNLLFVVLDTVRADHLAPYGYERVTTPHLDEFVQRHATRYTEARSSSSWTLPSHATLFTGLLPSEHGSTFPSIDAQPLRDEFVTLAERLREEGYETAAVVANTLFVVPQFGLDQGFEHFDDRRGCWVADYLALPQLAGYRMRAGHTPYRDAGDITRAALGWLESERRDDPFFLMLNYMDAHTPYRPPAPFDRAFEERMPADELHPRHDFSSLLYDRELAYLDSQLALLLEGLRALGLFENTVIVITSDHGEALGDRGNFGHSATLFEELVRVPLYVKPIGEGSPGTNGRYVNGADVHDMMLEQMGLKPEPREHPSGVIGEWHMGPRLSAEAKQSVERVLETSFDEDLVPAWLGWMEGRVKYLAFSHGWVGAFDLDRDPEERQPLSISPGARAEARAKAEAWWRRHPVAPDGREQVTDRETLNQLKALGYLDDE